MLKMSCHVNHMTLRNHILLQNKIVKNWEFSEKYISIPP